MNESSQRTPSERINLGIWGTGEAALNAFAPALVHVPAVRLWSICSRDREQATNFGTRFDARSPRPAHDEASTFLGDPNLHAVVLATPDRLQEGQAHEAIRAGKSVLLTSGAIERVSMLQELHSAAKANGVVVGFGDRLVHHRGHQLIAGRLKENALGKLHHLRFLIARQPLLPKVWRHEPAFARWGVLATHGADVAALVYELLKSYKPRCEKVYVDVAVDGHGFDRTVHGLLRVPEGPTIELTLSDLFNGPSRFEIFGENGTITAQGTLEGASQGKIEGVRGPFIYTGVDLAVGRLRSFVKAALEERLEAGTMLRSRFVAEFLNLLYSGGPQNDDTQADESSGGNGAYEFEDEPREQTSPQLDLPLEPVVSANEDTDASASVTTSPPSENVAQDESEGEGETIVDDEVVEPMPDVDDQ